jgi:hypothetical protein
VLTDRVYMLAAPSGDLHAGGEFSPSVADRLARPPGRGGDERVTAVPNRHRFRGCPTTARALIEQRGHHDELANDGGFHIDVTFHGPGRSTDLGTLAS